MVCEIQVSNNLFSCKLTNSENYNLLIMNSKIKKTMRMIDVRRV